MTKLRNYVTTRRDIIPQNRLRESVRKSIRYFLAKESAKSGKGVPGKRQKGVSKIASVCGHLESAFFQI